jgi:organic radical activating enzyme
LGFPISFHCNLRCPYCFNTEFYNYLAGKTTVNKWRDRRPFTIEQYKAWRDKHLTDATSIVMHLFGGEPFCKRNLYDVLNIISVMDKEKIDLLTNGVGFEKDYDNLKQYVNKIHRIGFTFHRSVIGENDYQVKQFEQNVMRVAKFFPNVYVKELLIKEHRDAILRHRDFWRRKEIDFKIQDFKGMDRGWSGEAYKDYTPVDNFLVDPEYKHYGNECTCMKGYKSLFIRGYDMADVDHSAGDVIGCWHDPCVVGNILEDWYSPDNVVKRSDKGIEVVGCNKLYRGTYEKDLYVASK